MLTPEFRPLLLKLGLIVAIAMALNMHAHSSPLSDYRRLCQGCHQVDGSGIDGEVPAFNNDLGTLLTIEGGREYLSSVPGIAQAHLSAEKKAELLNWILYFYSNDGMPVNFQPYTAAEMVSAGLTPVLNAKETRRTLLQQRSLPE